MAMLDAANTGTYGHPEPTQVRITPVAGNAILVSGHDLIDELSDEKRFDKAVRGALRRVRSVGGDGLFTADTNEPNWSKAHNILLPNFSQSAMQA